MRLAERLPDIHPEQQYIVAQEPKVYYTMNGREKPLPDKGGMVTDLTSVPRFLRWHVGRVRPHLEAAIVHDYLYEAWQFNKSEPSRERMWQPRRFADDPMLAAMLEAGMGCRARLIYLAIRWGGRGSFLSRNLAPLVLDLDALRKRVRKPSAGGPHDDPSAGT
ncbi:MAG: DUF1353 domain-containing protein [Chloroflexi bacterium]|nr:DUF1353 domain-containing protein [Chloroflexota bacterium]